MRGALTPYRIAAAVTTVVALVSVVHSGAGVWRRLGTQQRVYAGYSSAQRSVAPVADIPLPTGIFEFFAANIRRDDRVYFEVRPGPFSAFFDLPGIVSEAGRYFFLPAVQVQDPRDATVVISWRARPSALRLRYSSRIQYDGQAIYLSRVARE